MMGWHSQLATLMIAALIAGQAVHWFISGSSAAHSTLRNSMVWLQLAAGIALMIWTWRESSRRTP